MHVCFVWFLGAGVFFLGWENKNLVVLFHAHPVYVNYQLNFYFYFPCPVTPRTAEALSDLSGRFKPWGYDEIYRDSTVCCSTEQVVFEPHPFFLY